MGRGNLLTPNLTNSPTPEHDWLSAMRLTRWLSCSADESRRERCGSGWEVERVDANKSASSVSVTTRIYWKRLSITLKTCVQQNKSLATLIAAKFQAICTVLSLLDLRSHRSFARPRAYHSCTVMYEYLLLHCPTAHLPRRTSAVSLRAVAPGLSAIAVDLVWSRCVRDHLYCWTTLLYVLHTTEVYYSGLSIEFSNMTFQLDCYATMYSMYCTCTSISVQTV